MKRKTYLQVRKHCGVKENSSPMAIEQMTALALTTIARRMTRRHSSLERGIEKTGSTPAEVTKCQQLANFLQVKARKSEVDPNHLRRCWSC